MKIRHGLISNSSSSSFICDRPIKEVATEMWKLISRDEEYSKARSKLFLSKIKKLCKQEDVQTGKYGICFPSYNYDTQIIVKDRSCIIDTCNNHIWYDNVDGLVSIGDDDEHYEKRQEKFFYYVHANNLLLKPTEETLPENSNIQLYCSKCNKKWGKQNLDKSYVQDYYVGIDGSKYCYRDFKKLEEIEKPKF